MLLWKFDDESFFETSSIEITLIVFLQFNVQLIEKEKILMLKTRRNVENTLSYTHSIFHNYGSKMCIQPFDSPLFSTHSV